MAKYRAKQTTVVEAFKIVPPMLSSAPGNPVISIPDWLVSAIAAGHVRREGDKLILTTMHGPSPPVGSGIYIVREPDGEHVYPCDPKVFEARYEEVK